MERLTEFFIRHRRTILIVFAALVLLSLPLIGIVRVNYDLTDYLPEDSRTKLSIDKLESTFGYPSIAQVMLEDVSIPEAVEQVRARQIFALTQEGAQRAQISLASGTDFGKLAWEYSPESGGELGWFPRGYLLYPEVEAAAFSLEVGGRSEIIQSTIGYHIIEVQAHEAAHLLTTDARISLQTKALEDWLSTAIATSQIVIQVP